MSTPASPLTDSKPLPLEIKRGSVRVRIYTGTKTLTKGSRAYTYPEFTVCYYEGARRLRARFRDSEKAKGFAQNVADKLSKGQHAVLQLTSADAAIYLQAREQLKSIGLPLNVAIAEFVSAQKLLPAGTTLQQAAQQFAQRQNVTLEKRTLQQAVDELLSSKAAARRSEVHLKDLEARLTRFSEAFPNYELSAITGTNIQQFVSNLKLQPRTQLNFVRHIGSLFRFAIKRKYLPKEAIEVFESLDQPEINEEDVQIFTPGEMREILAVARQELIPWLTIGAFAGLRSAEINRLDWANIDLTENHITVSAGKAKTGSRRVVPISPNLGEWLRRCPKREGKIMPFASWWNELSKIAAAVNAARPNKQTTGDFNWHRNALRHSFCSYRLANTADVARVAYEAGNSAQMIHKHYKALVSENQAKEWFSIAPAK